MIESLSQKLNNEMAFDENGNKIDGRKFNKGVPGVAGRKKNTVKSDLMIELEKGDKDIIPIIIERAAKGDKDFIKLWASYRFGNPTAMEKDLGVNTGSIDHDELLNILRYDFEDDDDLFED